MLLSAGGFAQYRAETHIYNTLAPHFGGMRTPEDISAALDIWLASDCHRLTGLTNEEVTAAIIGHARTAGDFLQGIMGRMVERQGATRWAETTPAHVLHLREIRADLPSALFVHVIRDGRDVAASLEKQGWIQPFAFDRGRAVLAAAAFWDWIVRAGRREGEAVGRDAYLEVRYEALVEDPVSALAPVEAFIGQRLDWEAITQRAVGSVGRPNTSFPEAAGRFQGRWKSQLTERDARDVDAMLAPTLRQLGYETDAPSMGAALRLRAVAYATRFRLRDWAKRRTPLGRRATKLSHFAPGSMTISDEKLHGVHGS